MQIGLLGALGKVAEEAIQVRLAAFPGERVEPPAEVPRLLRRRVIAAQLHQALRMQEGRHQAHEERRVLRACIPCKERLVATLHLLAADVL